MTLELQLDAMAGFAAPLGSAFRCIVADPPWDLKFGSKRTPCGDKDGWDANMQIKELEYPTMSIAEICALKVPAADDAHLYIWTVNKYIEETYAVARAWGFKPSTMLYWLKQPIGLGLGGGIRSLRRANPFLSAGQARAEATNRPQLVGLAAWSPQPKAGAIPDHRGVCESRPISRNVCPAKTARLGVVGQRNRQRRRNAERQAHRLRAGSAASKLGNHTMKTKPTKTKRAARSSRAATGSAAALDFAAIMERADTLYAQEKTKNIPRETLAYWAPEMFPKIQSDQIKCVLRALLEALDAKQKQPNDPSSATAAEKRTD